MAYFREIIRPKCTRCKVKYATKTLIDRWNGHRGEFCNACAVKAKRELEALTEKQP